MTSLVNNPDIKKGVSFFTIVLDVGMQIIILARVKHNWNTGAWKKGLIKRRIIALILFAFYTVYLIFFAILSAVGFFMVEVQKTESEIVAIQETQKDNKDRLKEISEELKAWNIQLATEGKTGYGDNSKEIKEEIRKLKEERAKTEANNQKSLTIKQETVKSAINSFEVLSKKLGVNRDNLETIVFGIAVIMLYVFIILLTEGEFKKNPAITQAMERGKVLPDTFDESKKELLTFVEALFTDNKKLNGDPVVSQKTGIPEERCAKYPKYLSGLKIGDKTAIFKTQGGSVSNFPKADLLDYLRTNAPEIV